METSWGPKTGDLGAASFILKNAQSMCDKLAVGVTADELAKDERKKALAPFKERRKEETGNMKYDAQA